MKNISLYYDYKSNFGAEARKGTYNDGSPYIVVTLSDNEDYLFLFFSRKQAEKLRNTLSSVIEQFEDEEVEQA